MEKIELDKTEEAYREAGRRFLDATTPITDYYWGARIQTLHDGTPKHQSVIAPATINSNERLYAVSSENFPGWFQTAQRYDRDGLGIAIAKYKDVSAIKSREELIICTKNPNRLFDTHFKIIPDEILLASLRQFKFRTEKQVKVGRPNVESGGKHWDYDLVTGIGLAVYSKDHIKKFITDESRPWLDLSSGIANPYTPFEENGQNMLRDSHNIALQDFTWPLIVYEPNLEGFDPFSWLTVQSLLKVEGNLPKTITWHTAEINKITNNWLKPFAAGIREVSQDQK